MPISENMERYLSAFEQIHGSGAAKKPTWLGDLRHAAIKRFAALGFPTSRDEDWKYTSVDPVAGLVFGRRDGEGKRLTDSDLGEASFIALDSQRLVFVNGIFNAALSRLRDLQEGVRVGSLAEAIDGKDKALEGSLGRCARHDAQPFVALNTAFMEDGAFISIPRGCRVEEPIYLVFASVTEEIALTSHPRSLIIFGAGSEAKIVEYHFGIGDKVYFNNPVTEVIAEQGAVIDHYRLQQESTSGLHIGTVEARLKEECSYTNHVITLGGSLVRNDLRVVLDGRGSACHLNGLYLADDQQHLDNHTEIEHSQPQASSAELYKGILSGSARGVFNGKIVVHKDAQKTNARQTNKNLLLSENAAVNTKPQLEIYADDVKCSHGSTIGQLDDDALFYLRSRGLGLDDARSLLSYAFASDLVNRVKIPVMAARLQDHLLTFIGQN